MVIRKATLNDTEVLEKFYEASLANMVHLQPRQFRPAAQDPEFATKAILRENAEIFLLEEEGEAVAMASVFLEEREERPYRFGYSFAALDTLFVSEYHRGKGYARALFEAVRMWAKGNGAENIQLMTLGENKEARAFYESLGMKESSVFYILEDV